MSEKAVPAWTMVPLGDVISKLVNGGTPPTDMSIYWNGATPWITGADFTDQGIGPFRRYVSAQALRRTATNKIEAGQILIVTRTGVGKIAVAPCDLAISQDITAVYPNREVVDPRFLCYRMRRGVEELKKLNQGTSINGIVRRDLLLYVLQLPPMPEQRCIAEILSTVDDAIEQTEALIAKSQQIKAGLMHDLFTRGLTADGRLRPPREEAPDRYKQSPLGGIPKEWDVGRLAERSDSSRAYLKTGPFGSSLKLEHWVGEGIPVVTIGSLGENDFIEDELLHVTNETARRLNQYALIEGDIVFSRVADVGRSAVIRKANSGWIMSSNLLRIHVDTSRVVPDFLQAQLSSASVLRGQIRRKVNSGGRDVANSATLSQVMFIWPPIEEQWLVAERYLEFLASVRHAWAKVGALSRLKSALMHDLLTGRVRVPVPQKEP